MLIRTVERKEVIHHWWLHLQKGVCSHCARPCPKVQLFKDPVKFCTIRFKIDPHDWIPTMGPPFEMAMSLTQRYWKLGIESPFFSYYHKCIRDGIGSNFLVTNTILSRAYNSSKSPKKYPFSRQIFYSSDKIGY